MIRSLKDTTDKNTEQDWLKTNLARFTRLLQGQREMLTVCKLILSELAPLVKAQHGVFYGMEGGKGRRPSWSPSELCLQGAQESAAAIPFGRRPGRGVRSAEAAHPAHQRAERLCADQLRPWEATPMNVVVLPVMFRRGDQSRHRVGVLRAFQPHPSRLHGTAHREHRHRAQYHRGQLAHRSAAAAVAKNDGRDANPGGGVAADKRRAGERQVSGGKGQSGEIGFPVQHEP